MFKINIVLLEPRMPGNVGTIGRLCYAIGASLHLIKPYGFGDITQKEVKRAGLDYWEFLDVVEYENLEQFYKTNQIPNRCFFSTTKTKKYYFDIDFKDGDFIFFGREDAGLPSELLEKYKDKCINIPMVNDARSLNLANAVSIIAYESIKQNISQFKLN
jgi:tRNA (cytidine/uridine-2'-O-)-methyltransferase